MVEGGHFTMHILLVENDSIDQDKSLLTSLEKGGYEVCLAHTPTSAAQKILSMWPNIIVLNPANSLNVIDFKEALAKNDLDVPFMVVGTQSDSSLDNTMIINDVEQFQDLDHSIQQVVEKQKDRFVRLPQLTVDLEKHSVLRAGQSFPLTPKEFKLLQLLLDHQNQIIKRSMIMQEVWETDYMGDTRTLDVHIRWLREKIEETPSRPKYLITVRGVGYRFSTDFV